ncbi:MAG: sugar transferase [Bacteroidales bacterium]
MNSKYIRNRESTLYYMVTFVEIMLSIIAFHTAMHIRNYYFTNEFLYDREYQILLLIMIFSWFFLLKTTNFEKFHRTKSYSAILVDYTKGILIGSIILMGAIFIFRLDVISRGFVAIFTILNLLVLFFFRVIFYESLKYFRSQGKNRKNVLIIGDDTSDEIINRIIINKEWGLKIDKVISNSQSIYSKYHLLFTILKDENNIHELLDRNVIDEVIYCKNNINQNELNELIFACEEVGVVFHLYSNCWVMTGRKYHLSYFGEMPYFTFMNKPSDQLALFAKDLIDYTMGLIYSILLSPVMLLIALAIKVDSSGPVFFKQERIGLRGRKFNIYKFRTMVTKAEELREEVKSLNEMDGPVFKIKNDPRITKVGRLLRKTGLDELPQLFNILKGEMSFIGPRPPIEEEVKQYERWQLRRLSMKPGISCIWQTMPKRNEIFFSKWMELDLQYIDSWSLKLDLILFFRTFRTIIMGSGR